MLIAESGRVHLRGRCYEGCATIVLSYKIQKFLYLSNTQVRKIFDIQQIFTLRITAIRHGV